MNLSSCWTEITPVFLSDEVYHVFDIFCAHPDWPFLPILDKQHAPIGIVREYDLKQFAYARFGRELVKRYILKEFLEQSLILPVTISRDELLKAAAKNPNPDGIILTEHNIYRASLLTQAVIHIFEEQRAEMESRLIQSQKMEAIGTMAGGVAHDLNNILTPILGYADLMQKTLANGDPIDPDDISDLLISAQRAKKVVGQILTFSRHKKSEQALVKVSDIAKEVLRIIGSSLPSTIDTETCFTIENDIIMADPTELHQVVLNLCTNAYHAMRSRGGHLQISTCRHEGPLLGWTPSIEEPPDGFIRLSISDTGSGIEPHVLPRIFDPFFTTKSAGEGTGMGLSVAHGIVSRCHGFFSVETKVGHGTTFHVYLPPHEQTHLVKKENLAGATPDSTPTHTRTLKALFVDDEYQIARLAKRFLSRYQIDVEAESNSRIALTYLEDRNRHYDVLITDQLMPELTGLELAKHSLRLRPELPILLCTGYSETVSSMDAKAIGIRAYMQKPPDFEEMARLIRQWANDKNPSPPPTQIQPANATKQPSPQASERPKALFVDDEHLITTMAQKFLSRYGIDVQVENSVAKAIRLLEDPHRHYDALITDHVMPELSGLRFTRQAVQLRPQLPVILCTGYGETVHPEDARAMGIWAYMIKPPDFQEMARLIHGWRNGTDVETRPDTVIVKIRARHEDQTMVDTPKIMERYCCEVM